MEPKRERKFANKGLPNATLVKHLDKVALIYGTLPISSDDELVAMRNKLLLMREAPDSYDIELFLNNLASTAHKYLSQKFRTYFNLPQQMKVAIAYPCGSASDSDYRQLDTKEKSVLLGMIKASIKDDLCEKRQRTDDATAARLEFTAQAERIRCTYLPSNTYEEDINYGMDIHDHIDTPADNHEQELDEIDMGERDDPGQGECLDYRD